MVNFSTINRPTWASRDLIMTNSMFEGITSENSHQRLDEIDRVTAYWAENPNRLIGIADLLAYTPEPALINGYMPSRGLGQLYGPSYTGKSYVAVDLALSVCAGLSDWMGLPLNLDCTPQHVVYVAAEGGLVFRDAVVSWLEMHAGADISRLHVLDGGKGGILNLTPTESESGASSSWTRLATEVNQLVGQEDIALIIIDPQINVMSSVDENSNREMAEVFGQLKAIADDAGALLLMVHHTGLEKGRARGASSQFGILDLVISLEGAKGKGAITFKKVKGASQPEHPIKFSISSVDIDNGTRSGAMASLEDSSTYVTKEEKAAEQAQGQAELLARSRKKLILKTLACGHGSANAIQAETKLSRNIVGPLLKTLETEGKVVNEGSTSRPAWRLA